MIGKESGADGAGQVCGEPIVSALSVLGLDITSTAMLSDVFGENSRGPDV
jgi:hypothetical protein